MSPSSALVCHCQQCLYVAVISPFMSLSSALGCHCHQCLDFTVISIDISVIRARMSQSLMPVSLSPAIECHCQCLYVTLTSLWMSLSLILGVTSTVISPWKICHQLLNVTVINACMSLSSAHRCQCHKCLEITAISHLSHECLDVTAISPWQLLSLSSTLECHCHQCLNDTVIILCLSQSSIPVCHYHQALVDNFISPWMSLSWMPVCHCH